MKKTILLLFHILFLLSCNTSEKETKVKSIDSEVESIKSTILQKAKFGKEIIEASAPYLSPSIKSNGNLITSYELHIANNYRLPMELSKVEIFDIGNSERPFITFDSSYIKENIDRPGLSNEKVSLFEGNQFGVLNIWLSVDQNSVPKQFYHKLHFNVPTGNGETGKLDVEKALVTFPTETDLILSPPFREGYWFYYTIGHKNTRELTEGKPSYAQRFAIDWASIDEDGTFVKGERNKNESFVTYGKEILAVADGVIIEIQDNIPDNAGESNERAVKLNRYNLSGNHLVLDIGNGINVVYAHLIPNSFKFKVGDRVKTGDVIGLLGNSGESTGPHLHMHVETSNKLVLGGEGLPYKLKEFSEITVFDDNVNIDSLFTNKKLPINNLNNKRRNEIPMGVGVVKF